MKAVQPLAILVTLLLLLRSAGAQETPPLNPPDYNKPKVFADLPEKLPLNISDLESLLLTQKGATVNKIIAQALVLNGTVMSTYVSKDSAIQTVVIRTTRQNATFSFSRIRKPNNRLSYKAQLLTSAASDALELVFENGNWALRKRGYYDIVSE